MQARPFAATTYAHPDRLLFAVAALGCLLAIILGAVATTHYGVLVGSAIVGISFLGVAVATYLKDPVLALICLWLFDIFNAPLSAVFGYYSTTGQAVRQSTEVMILLFTGFTLWRTLRTTTRIPFSSWRFVVPGAGVALFGLLGSVVHSVPLTTSMLGALLGLKLWIMIVVSLLLPWQLHDLKRIYNALTIVGLVVATLGLLDYLTHGAVSRALHTSNYFVHGAAYRSEAVHSIFPSPGEYSLFMSLLFAVTFARFTSKYNRSDLILALLFAGSVILSLRLKGFLSIAAVIAVVGVAQGAVDGRRALITLLIGVIVVGGAYGLEGSVISKQLSQYSSSESSARSRLYSVGEQIADDDFPIGVGFGRFASYPSRISYSPVYFQYKLSMVWGLSPKFPNFIDDTSWPSVIGETGYGGLAIYVIGLLFLTMAVVRRLRIASHEMKWLPLGTLCAIAVLLVDSLGDPTLFSWLATATLAMLVGPALCLNPSPTGRQQGIGRARSRTISA